MARARTAASSLARLCSASTAPLYALDEARRIVFANGAVLDLLQVSEADLLGRRCDYHSASDNGAALAGALCPPPEAFRGELVSFVVSRVDASGAAKNHLAVGLPLAGGTAESAAVLVKLTTENREASGPPHHLDEAKLWHRRLAAHRRQMEPGFRFDRLIGQSPVMRRVRAQVELASRAPCGVLIVGPKGSGREHLARAIHLASGGDSAGPLVPLPCSILDAEIVQITIRRLKRRPTGVDRERPGVLLLLDVDQMPPDAQDELAGFLNLPDFRISTLATARRPLADLAAAAGFRHDLACALGTLVVELPPLAQRREDIPLLAQMLLEDINREGGLQLSGFTPEALDELAAYPWPGNLDELIVFVREAYAHAEGTLIGTPDLPQRIRLACAAAAHPPLAEEIISLDDFLADVERELLERALARAKGNRSKAAALLGVNRARLLRRLVQLGLTEPSADGEPIPFEEVTSEETVVQE